ncbi:AfsR/SARP family transcriptional regulator [Glycomyces salinus]|uniref:AfsR/SARP family transcriptional regulator n=1 Tax=Glycomyces salinus TaxID=980294 RepID=UPI0018ED9691|nr:BTAD domain-containing putative transcriptional regulator [Glycomyces salinus]
MEFRILGPVEVVRDGREIRFPRRAAVRLLAALLIRPGWRAPADELAETIWNDAPPRTARRQIQNAAALIRRELGDDGRILSGDGDGYAIEADESVSDSMRFRSQVGLARAARARGDLAASLSHLRAALELWRGPALAGLEGPRFEAAAQALDEERRRAVEERLDLEMRVEGDFEGALPELRRRCAEHPHRQRLWALLMTALHRLGRTPEALDAYQSLRRSLVEDLGIDPATELRELHAAILRDDLPVEAPPPAEARPRPSQLPSDTATFTGRPDELDRLERSLRDEPTRPIVVTGLAGSGKTASAIRAAHRVRDRFPDGQLFIDLHGEDRESAVGPREALAHLLDALGTAAVPESTDSAAGLYRSTTAGRRVLVVLDNALDAAQVRPLLPAEGCAAVVTSRNRLSGLAVRDDARSVRLEPLGPEASLDLLAALVGAERIAAAPEAARELCARCAGLPLALRIAAARLNEDGGPTVAELCEELRTHRLEALAIDDDPAAAVEAAFDTSLKALDADARDLFLRLGLLPGNDFAHETAAAVAGSDLAAAARLVRRIEGASLLDPSGKGRSRFHDLVKEHARVRAEAELDGSVQQLMHDRHAQWCHSMSGRLPAAEFPNVRSALQRWRGHRRGPLLAQALGGFVLLGFDAERIRRDVEAAIAADGGDADASSRHEAYFALYQVHWTAGHPARALEYARAAASMAEGLPPEEDAAAHYNLSASLYVTGNYAESETHLRRAELLARKTGSPRLSDYLGSLGHLTRALGDYPRAEALCREAIDLAVSGGKETVAPEYRISYAVVLIDLGRHREAAEVIDEVERQAEADGATRFTMMARWWRGESHRLQGRYDRARPQLESALAEAVETGRHAMARGIRMFLADALNDAGLPERALELARSAVEGQESRLAELERARLDLLLCKIHHRSGEHRLAVEHGERARERYGRMPDRLRHARSLAALAEAHAGAGETSAAEALRREADDAFAALGVPRA